MAYSMTGLGIGEVETPAYSVRVELKSINSRFLEISCRLPSGLSRREKDVRDLLRSRIERGKIYLQVSIQNSARDMLDFQVKPESVELVRNTLEKLRDAASIKSEITLDHILKFSEIFETSEDTDDNEDLWSHLQNALNIALDELKKMRSQEGESLVLDIRGRLQTLANNLTEIESISAENPDKQFVKLQTRLAKLLQDTDMDPERLKTEIALLADKSDITEESVRLRSHFQLLENTLQQKEPTGKKLNFLVQELNREVNTIGSKANNAEVNHLCVNMKGEIEKIREQVQNLE